MKRNLIFLGILILLGVFAYVFEEVGGEKRRAEEKAEKLLLDPAKLGDMIRIKLPFADLEKKDGKFVIKGNGIDVDEEKLQAFLDALARIQISRRIPKGEITEKNREDYFPNKMEKFIFGFTRAKVDFLVGSKLEFDQTFYVEIKNGNEIFHVIAEDTSTQPAAYDPKEVHRSDAKYRRIKSLLYLKEEFFYNTRPFKRDHFKDNPIVLAEIDNVTNRKFTLDFGNTSSQPQKMEGLEYDKNFFHQFIFDMAHLKAETVYFPYKKENLKDKVSTIVLTDRSGKKYELTIHRKMGSLDGYFLTTNFTNKVYELARPNSKPFFANVQDFWELKIPYLRNLKDFKINFGEKEEWIDLRLANDRAFRIDKMTENVKKNPDHVAFKKLFEFLTTRADRVSEFPYEPKKPLFKLNFNGAVINVIIEGNEIQLWDTKGAYILHYLVGEEPPMGVKFTHYFL